MRHLDRQLPSLNWLHALEVAARHGSFTGAAREMNVSQTAVSRMVRVLEDHLGYLLFERSANCLTLTPRGRLLLPGITKAFASISNALDEAASSSLGPVLTVGVGRTFAEHWLIPRLSRYSERFPDVEIRLAISSSFTPLKSEWTCAIRYDDYYNTDYTTEPLWVADLIPVCSPRVAARLGSVTDLKSVPLLRVTTAAEDWPVWLQAAGIPADGLMMKAEFDSYAMVVQAASQGMGVALAFEPYVAHEIEAGFLVAPLTHRGPKNRTWALAYRSEHKERPELRSFGAWLRSEVAASRSLRRPVADPTAELAQ